MNFLDMIGGKLPKTVPVPTPEWPDADGKVFVRRLSAVDRVAFSAVASAQGANQGVGFLAFLVAFCASDADGNRGFADNDWKTLQEQPGTVIERISEAADELNVLSNAARDAQKKTYATIPDSGNTSALPEASASP